MRLGIQRLRVQDAHGNRNKRSRTLRRRVALAVAVRECASPQGSTAAGCSEKGSKSGRSDTELILAKIAELKTELKTETAVQRAANKAEFNKALQTLASRMEAPVLTSEDEEPEPRKKVTPTTEAGKGQRPFARPMGQQAFPLFAPRMMADTLQNAADPIARLREDGASAAQA